MLGGESSEPQSETLKIESSSNSASESGLFSSFVGVSSDQGNDGSESEAYWSPAAVPEGEKLSPVNSVISLSSRCEETTDAESLASGFTSQAESSNDVFDSSSETESLLPAEQPPYLRDETPVPEKEPERMPESEVVPSVPVKISTVATLPVLTPHQKSQCDLLEDIAASPNKYWLKIHEIMPVTPTTNLLWRRLMDDVDNKLKECGLSPLVGVSYCFLATHYPDAHEVIKECAEIIVNKIEGWYGITFRLRLPFKLEYPDEDAKTGDLTAVIAQLRIVALNQPRTAEIMMIPRFRRKCEPIRSFCDRFLRNTYPRVPERIQNKWLNEAAPILIGNALRRHYPRLAKFYLRNFEILPDVDSPEGLVSAVCALCSGI